MPIHLKNMAQFLSEDDPRREVILGISKHFSPQQFNDYTKKHPDTFRVYGRWESDVENNSLRLNDLGRVRFCS